MEKSEFKTLNNQELLDTNGGELVVIAVVTAIGVTITAATAAYNVAKDYAYEQRSKEHAINCYEGKCNGNCRN